jgi:hypothetical protein
VAEADVLRNGEDVRHGAILDDAEPLVAAELAMTDNQVAVSNSRFVASAPMSRFLRTIRGP